MDLHKRADELYDVIEPYMILLFELDSEGYSYKLKEDAPEEVRKADRELRSFAKDLEPIR
ncbi:hypothetical protein HMPREF2626_01555 [Aerococcus sp. HMSC062A02]|uniref:hypothetical protein n=1 Tax=Aerococcus sp. HMSC062A02 TaxID=1715105 RepID=UPI0008A1D460|nr:hypothetical protein [Aerococcus sp. HMSC062A02]OFN02623.1 hypothetical protein HMPREF2626_01555 [Aerococcus sp. HMSC062A02]